MQSLVCLGKHTFASLKLGGQEMKLQRWVVRQDQALERAPNWGGDKSLHAPVLGVFTKAKSS